MSKTLHHMFRGGIWGIGSLCAVNIAAGFTGVSLGFGWMSGGVAAILGVPGVVGLLLLNAIFVMG